MRERRGKPFEVALQVTRAGNLFTTHTPVAAGFDRFPPDLVRQHLGNYAESQLGLSFRDLMALGRQNPDDDQEPFNMAYLAIRGSGAVNGVSQLHGEVSRSIFQPLFPRWPAGRGAHWPRHERHPCTNVGFSGFGRVVDQALRQRALAGRDEPGGRSDTPGARPGIMGYAPGLPADVG